MVVKERKQKGPTDSVRRFEFHSTLFSLTTFEVVITEVHLVFSILNVFSGNYQKRLRKDLRLSPSKLDQILGL